MTPSESPADRWKRGVSGYTPEGYVANQRRMTAYQDSLRAMKGQLGTGLYRAPTVLERYERVREEYASGRIDLEDFTAVVVALLKEGL